MSVAINERAGEDPTLKGRVPRAPALVKRRAGESGRSWWEGGRGRGWADVASGRWWSDRGDVDTDGLHVLCQSPL